DSDGDGLGDNADAFPNDSSETVDSDLDGIGDNADVFPNDPTESADTDLDGIGDNADAFPNDASETLDSDSDGTGDNADVFPNNALYKADSDLDGMPDAWEIRYGLDPNDPSDATSDQDNDGITALDEFLAGTIPSGSIDLDGNKKYDALTDGLLLLRGMFGLDGSALVTGTIASDAIYTESVDIESRIATLGDLADIDGNGEIDALTDGLLTLRYLFGLEGDTLINGVVAGDATRKTAEEIEAHLETLMPAL
ncbi:MSCRAMM family adhesin SdrC, partial [Porticoccaceae bacterium]|nr:MSCRAMM family adhesin SdrC [Porticoccaceae bacterium]